MALLLLAIFAGHLVVSTSAFTCSSTDLTDSGATLDLFHKGVVHMDSSTLVSCSQGLTAAQKAGVTKITFSYKTIEPQDNWTDAQWWEWLFGADEAQNNLGTIESISSFAFSELVFDIGEIWILGSPI